MESGDSLSRGIHCMESNIREMDTALTSFVGDTVASKYSSWKYPHLEIGKLNMDEILIKLRDQNITRDVRYIHLAELCIDRLYYALISSVHQLQDMCVKFNMKDRTAKENLAPLGTLKRRPFLVDPLKETSRIVDFGKVVRHLETYFTLIDSVRVVHPNNEVGESDDSDFYYVPLPESDGQKCGMFDKFVQTDDILIESCSACFAIQSVFKTVGEILESCMKEAWNKPTCISQAKIDLRGEIFWCSQWIAIKRWCTALETDCHSIIRRIAENIQQHAALERRAGMLNLQLGTNERGNKVICDKLEKSLHEMEKTLAAEKKAQLILIGKEAELMSEIEVLEKEVKECEKENLIDKAKAAAFKKELDEMEKARIDATDVHNTLKDRIKDEKTESKNLQEMLDKLSEEKLAQEKCMGRRIEVLTIDLRVAEEENSQYKRVLRDLKAQLEKIRMQSNREEDDENRIPEAGDVIVTDMEHQIRANETRIQLLHDQNKLFAPIIAKLNN